MGFGDIESRVKTSEKELRVLRRERVEHWSRTCYCPLMIEHRMCSCKPPRS